MAARELRKLLVDEEALLSGETWATIQDGHASIISRAARVRRDPTITKPINPAAIKPRNPSIINPLS